MKHLVVLTAKCKFHENVVLRVKSKVPKSSNIVTTSENIDSVLNKIRIKPFLSKYYILEIFMKGIKKDNLKSILKQLKNNQAIFYCFSIKEYETLTEELKRKNLEYIEINNYRPPLEVFAEYWENKCNLEVTEQELKKIYKRLQTKFSMCDYHIEQINNQILENKEINLWKCIPNYNSLTFEKMWFSLLEGNNKKEVYKLYDDYRYGFRFVSKKLDEYADNTIQVFTDLEQGKIDYRNKNKYVEQCEFIKSTYGLDRYIKLFNEISFEELMYIKTLTTQTVNNSLEMLILIMKIRGRCYNERS